MVRSGSRTFQVGVQNLLSVQFNDHFPFHTQLQILVSGGGGLFLKKIIFHTIISLHRYILSSTAAVTLPILNSIFFLRIPSTLKKKSVKVISTGPSTLS